MPDQVRHDERLLGLFRHPSENVNSINRFFMLSHKNRKIEPEAILPDRNHSRSGKRIIPSDRLNFSKAILYGSINRLTAFYTAKTLDQRNALCFKAGR
jgi:hypothetical protein